MERTAYEVEPVLRAVARTMQACLGFGTVVVNLHRAAWDDFETVVIVGSDDAREALLGQTSSAADWAPLLDPRFERRGAYHVKDGEYDWSQDPLTTWVPPCQASADPDAWSPEDALFVPLRSAAGEMLGILSVDEPADGRRPDDEKLDLIVGVAQHAALALEHAQEAAAAERQRVSVGHLLRLTASLAERRTIDEMLDAVCVGVRDALGFEKVVVAIENRAGRSSCEPPSGCRRRARTPEPPPRRLRGPAARSLDGARRRGADRARRGPRVRRSLAAQRLAEPAQRPRPARLGQPRADRAAARPRGRPGGRGLGR